MNHNWDGIPQVNFDQFFKNLVDKLMARLSRPPISVRRIDLKYNDAELKDIIKKEIPTPAIFIRFIQIRPQTYESEGVTLTKKQNNKIVAELRFKAWVVLDANIKNEARKNLDVSIQFASAVTTESRFGEPVGPSQITDISPETYINADGDEELITCFESYSVWKVEWFHEAFIGDQFTEGFCDELQIDPKDIREVYVSFDSQKGKIEAEVKEWDIPPNEPYSDGQPHDPDDPREPGMLHRIYKGVNPDNPDEEFTSDYTLIARIEPKSSE